MKKIHTGEYPADWEEISHRIKAKHNYCCERCGRPHDPKKGYTLTVHHLDLDKSNVEDWNLAALCQRCHLVIQGRVFMPQSFMFEHTDWMKPHVEGYYKWMEKRNGN